MMYAWEREQTFNDLKVSCNSEYGNGCADLTSRKPREIAKIKRSRTDSKAILERSYLSLRKRTTRYSSERLMTELTLTSTRPQN